MSQQKEASPASPADVQAVLVELEGLRTGIESLAPSTDVGALLTALERLRSRVEGWRERAPPAAPERPEPARPPAPAVPSLPEPLVTLDQIAAMVRLSKRSLERYRRRMPPPRVQGRRGRPHLWAWPEVRPWLEATFGLPLPGHFPGLSP